MRILRTTLFTVGLIAILAGCASAPAQHAAASCYWPSPSSQDCREFIEFNSWR
jgi:hypothetical protein